MSEPIYLDYAAATPLDSRVFSAMQPYMTEQFYNPSAVYAPARQVRADFEAAKHRIAMVIGAKPTDIIMTAGATESINIAIQGVMTESDHIVIGATEHPSVSAVAAGYNHSIASATSKGIITVEAVRACINDATKLVSITAADSEIGAVQSLKAIAAMIVEVQDDRRARGVAQPLYFHTDASQVVGVVDLQVGRLGVDMMTLNASKCYGPKQVGVLYSSSHVRLRPVLHGGGQEMGLRSGTENVAGTVGFAKALDIAIKRRHPETKRLSELRDYLQDSLTSQLSALVVNGHSKKRLPNIASMSYEGLDAERVVFHLDMKGVYVATGAACAANKGVRSTVLSAVGMSDSLVDGSLRFSLGHYTTKAQIDRAIPLIVEAIKTEVKL